MIIYPQETNPYVNDFIDYRIELTIKRSTQNYIPPIIKETMKKNYPGWYGDFEEWLDIFPYLPAIC